VDRFRQINQGKLTSHHDALEFPDGEIVLLTRMCEGQLARVLQLPATARPEYASPRPNDALTSKQLATWCYPHGLPDGAG
jgi:hypothetical protein